ncbi:MAG: hypothetical protein ACE5IO_10450 [Thermoplasmata archaeon]
MMSDSRLRYVPHAVIITTFAVPMAVALPVIISLEAVGWEPPPWWTILEFFYLLGIFSISTLSFTVYWDVLRFLDSPFSGPILGPIAIRDTIMYSLMSLSWIIIGMFLYVAARRHLSECMSFKYAFSVSVLGLLAQLILPWVLLADLGIWTTTILLPLPIPALIAVVGLMAIHYLDRFRPQAEEADFLVLQGI